ncbi:hypothetical protein J2S78_002054 [Salibacterium salarium]|uniref:phage baseplate protein n=1 Tax=Salibacterium salarium TaxID=284579 RepID=UPI0027814916|nr:hypothetical protein [Salibacterium salarium]MDQ0299634.1 hypothetical protein [Salibacterium salarium]
MARIGNVEFNAISEERNFVNEITDHPVEDEGAINDHVNNKPTTYTIEGIVVNPGAAQAHRDLISIRYHGDPVSYDGRATMKNAVIENLTTDTDVNISNGFNFNMTIKGIRVARPSTVGLLPADLKADTSEVGNAGRVQPQ